MGDAGGPVRKPLALEGGSDQAPATPTRKRRAWIRRTARRAVRRWRAQGIRKLREQAEAALPPGAPPPPPPPKPPKGKTKRVFPVPAGPLTDLDRALLPPAPELAPAEDGKLLGPIPRRATLFGGKPPQGDQRPAMAIKAFWRPSIPQTIVRLFLWMWGLLRFLAGCSVDWMRGNSTRKTRAVRLRVVFESLGASFIKVGQQLSIRADMVPYEYCEELGKMLDRVPPYSSDIAIATIERTTGKKLDEIFTRFDPKPIGSASLACVYQAYLKTTGERVAVKVRRPGIGEQFAADMQALRWLMQIGEGLTFLRPGSTESFLKELNAMLMGELNFRAEARFTDLFRRRARKKGVKATAPHVFFEYSNSEVIVSEFVSGIWMWELIAAIDRNDEAALAQIRSRGIDPKVVAKRLARAVHWESLENIFFHADPHPANIVIQPGNIICFIDFGACGRFSSKVRNLWKQLHFHILNEDVSRMVQAALGFAEPLPPIDVDKFSREIETMFWEWLYAVHSKDAQWWERSTGQIWIGYLNIARKYGVPINIESLQFFRATLLYDSIMFRLWSKIDLADEYRRYVDEAGQRARKRVHAAVLKRMGGPLKSDYLAIEEMAEMGNQFIYRVQKAIDTPIFNFTSMIGKAAFGFVHTFRMLVVAAIGTLVALVILIVHAGAMGEPIQVFELFKKLIAAQPYQLTMVAGAILVFRKILLRFETVDVK